MISKSKVYVFAVYTLIILLTIFLDIFHYFDSGYRYNWLIFLLWLWNVILAIAFFLELEGKRKISLVLRIIKEDFFIYLWVILLAAFARFFLLSNYPYVSVGDELRDPGLNALKISQGIIRDFFAFGSYQGYGNFIPLISYFLMLFLKTSILIYRIPAAIIGTFAVFITYLLTRVWTNKLVAFSAAIFLAVSIKHIHYSRTELLIVIESLLVLFILYAAYLTIKSWKGFFLLGISIGLIFHFYASTRATAGITVAYLLLLYLGKIIKSLIRKGNILLKDFRNIVFGLLLLITGFFIAIGPTINNLNIGNGFSQVGTTHPIIYDQIFQHMNLSEKFQYVLSSYKTAFLVYTFVPSEDFHLMYYQPMLTFPVNLFFIAGLIFIILKFSPFSYLLLTIEIIHPFLNQVLIGLIKHDHRLIGITPVLDMIAAYGFIKIMNFIIKNNQLRKMIILSFIGIFSLYQISLYFLQRPSDYNFTTRDYVFYSISQYIKGDKNHNYYYILHDRTLDLSLFHLKEAFEFLDYPKIVQVVDSVNFYKLFQTNNQQAEFITTYKNTEINQYIKRSVVHNCIEKTLIPKYFCPLNYNENYAFYILGKT